MRALFINQDYFQWSQTADSALLYTQYCWAADGVQPTAV